MIGDKVMEKNSKCIKCDFSKEANTDYGVIFYFNVAFENGDSGSYGSKSKDQPKFKVGETYDYDIITKDFNGMEFFTIKPFYKKGGDFNNTYDNKKGIFACSALNRAVDFEVGAKGKDASIENIKRNATDLFNWLNTIIK